MVVLAATSQGHFLVTLAAGPVSLEWREPPC